MAKILVTGAAGFIGFHLSQCLLERGDEVVGLDNLNDYYDVTLKKARLEQLLAKPNFSFHFLDLADREGMAQLFAESSFEKVVNLAAQAGVRYSIKNPHAYVDTNLVGFVNVLEGCRHSNVEYIDDIVEGVIRVIDKVAEPNTNWSGNAPDPATSYAPCKNYNIGNNQLVELMQFIETLENCLGMKAEKNLLPIQPGDVPATYADVDALVQDVGFKPNTSIELGIERFVKWHRSYYKV